MSGNHQHPMLENQASDGEWCWCPDVPDGQEPHCCVESGRSARPCQVDGAHVHLAEAEAVL